MLTARGFRAFTLYALASAVNREESPHFVRLEADDLAARWFVTLPSFDVSR